MSDKPENRSGGRRRRGGPLEEDTEQPEGRRRVSRGGSEDATQQIPTDHATQRMDVDDETRRISTGGQGSSTRSSDTQEFEAPTKTSSRKEQKEESRSSRVRPARTTGAEAGRRSDSVSSGGYGGYSTGYNEVLRDREEYLRDIYGGVDWLASFVGFIFTLLFAALLGAGAILFLLVPLGLQGSLQSGQLTSNVITGFAVIAVALFFSFLFGGYISGRMARYDGGRNGAMVLLWTILVAALLLVLSGVLGQAISGTYVGSAVGQSLSFLTTSADLLDGLGVAGIVIAGGLLLAALLGGTLGGRLGSRYHREIDYTP